MADLQSLADAAARRLLAISDRAASVARGVALLTLASMGLAYLVGSLVLPDLWRWVWIIGGLVLCLVPAIAILVAYRRLRRVPDTFDEMVAELGDLASDPEVRAALFELVDRDEAQDRDAALIELGRELNTLRRALYAHKDEVSRVWDDVNAITTLPGLMAIAVLGSFGGLLFSATAVLAKLIL